MVARERYARTKTAAYDTYPADTGCEHSPSCLTCPLPQCKHDMPVSVKRSAVHQKRLDMVEELVEKGLAPDAAVQEVAKALGCGPRAVYRSIQRVRKGEYKL